MNAKEIEVNEVKIELEGTGCYFRWTCDICGDVQEKDGMSSKVIISEDKDDYLEICRTCLDAGVEGAIERSIKHANRLQEQVNAIRGELPVYLHSVSEWKTGEDYDAAFSAFNDLLEQEQIKISFDKLPEFEEDPLMDSERADAFEEMLEKMPRVNSSNKK